MDNNSYLWIRRVDVELYCRVWNLKGKACKKVRKMEKGEGDRGGNAQVSSSISFEKLQFHHIQY